MKAYFVTALPLALLCAGCAGMGVQVDVLNPRYLEATSQASELIQAGHPRATRLIAQSRSELTALQNRCFDILIKRAEAVAGDPKAAGHDIAPGVVAKLKVDKLDPSSNLAIEQELEGQRMLLNAADDAARIQIGALTPVSPSSGKPVQIDPAVMDRALAARETVYANAAAELGRFARDTVCKKLAAPQADKAVVQSEANQSAERLSKNLLTSITGGGILLKDLNQAYFVTAADKRYWAQKYNRAFGHGYFGSTSIALKMNDTADFSVKGFTFDVTATAGMVQKVGTLAINTIARAYGAPFTLSPPSASSAPGTTNDASTPSQNRTATDAQLPEIDVARAAAEESSYRNGLFQVADTVMGNWDALVSGDTVAKDLLGATVKASQERYARPATTPPSSN